MATVWKRDTKDPSYTAQVRMKGHATRSQTFRRKTDAKKLKALNLESSSAGVAPSI